MNARLMHREADFDLDRPLPAHTEAVEQDLELPTVLDAMARGDGYLREIAERALLLPLTDASEILFRQEVLSDTLRNPESVRRLYALAVEGVESKRRAQVFWFRDSPDALLAKSLRILALAVEVLRELRTFAEAHTGELRSDGFTRLLASFEAELDDDYLAEVDDHLRGLAFRDGTLISAGLGRANRSTGIVLRKPPRRSLLDRIVPARSAYAFSVPDRDESGLESLAALRNRGVKLVAEALSQSTDHILGFFGLLRAELAFYVGALNLHEELAARGRPTCFPEPREGAFTARGLHDVALSFHLDGEVAGNDVDADGAELVVVTGANRGGKSTFLRSVGLAQLMLQAGMFVGAESFAASLRTGVFTHFKREEDAGMESGKLDEELARMSRIADAIAAGGLLLCNESFSSTTELEGSEIGRQVIRAMTAAGIRVFLVTHLYDLAHGLHAEQRDTYRFLRADRTRTFRLAPGEPLPTSFGADSYARVFGA